MGDKIHQRHGSAKEGSLLWFGQIDGLLSFFTKLGSIGIISVIVGAIIQYSAWRDEKNLTSYGQDLTRATETISEISNAFS